MDIVGILVEFAVRQYIWKIYTQKIIKDPRCVLKKLVKALLVRAWA